MPTKAKVLEPSKDMKEEDKIIETINKRWTIGTNFLKPYLENFTRYYKIYRSYVNDDKLPTRHKTFNPYLFSAIETATSKAVANKPKGSFSPRGPEDKQDTQDHNDVFDYYYQIKEEQTFLKTLSAFKKSMIYGTVIGEVFWRYETGFRDGKKTVTANRPGLRNLRLEDGCLVFDPDAESIESAKWFIKKETWTKKDVEDIKESPFAKQYRNLDKVLKAFDRLDFESSSYKQDKLSVAGATEIKDETIVRVDVLHQYAGGKIQTTVGKKHLVRDIANPFLFDHPFIYSVDHVVPEELLGMGEVEPTERLQHTLNSIENQRRDNVALVINRMWINTPRGADDEGELVSIPGGIINAKDVAGLKPVETPDVTSSSYNEAEAIKSDIQNALSISNFSKGTDEVDTTQKSGVAISKLQSAADARIQTKMQIFEECYLGQLAVKWLKLIYQYGDKTLKIKITGKQGEEWKELNKENIAGEYDYKVEAGSTQHTDKVTSRLEFENYMKSIIALADRKAQSMQTGINPDTGQPLPAQPKTINYDKLAETLSEKYGIKNHDEIWITEEQLQEQPQGEMLPSVELEERAKDYGDGAMLPSADLGDEEMLPGVEEKEMLPNINDI